jgi:hypothetical protein
MALYALTNYNSILREADGAMIPLDPGNSDYQVYLVWLAAGNTPDTAPIVAPPTVITTTAFWARFTPSEQTAVQQAAMSNPQIMSEMTFGLMAGQVNLTTGATLQAWMNDLVTAGAITSARMTVILTP